MYKSYHSMQHEPLDAQELRDMACILKRLYFGNLPKQARAVCMSVPEQQKIITDMYDLLSGYRHYVKTGLTEVEYQRSLYA